MKVVVIYPCSDHMMDTFNLTCALLIFSSPFIFGEGLMLCSRLDEGDVVSTCTHNRDAAAAVGRKDLVQVGWLY